MSRRVSVLLMAICAVLGGCVHNSPDRATLTLASYHIAERSEGWDYNAFNPGAVLTWEGVDIDISAGAFINSYSLPSVAGFVSVPLVEEEALVLEGFGGVAYYPVYGRRFPLHVGDIVPLAGLAARLGSLSLMAFPSDCVHTCAVFVGGVSFDL
ncbi:hypothetical protein [Pelagibacterium halotolerans]|uniref:hypothetical protein n=1 Tax=Pelagibacterium halotolerans TaxID=531813 RepID=UPI00384E0231